jgi:regulator of replication initiation timing
MDIAALNGVVQAINLTKQLAKAAFVGKVDAEAKAKIGEVLEKLGDVQDGMFNLREDLHRLQVERDDLKKKLDAADSWRQRAAAYKFTQTAGGAVVYISNDETPHYTCPSCFNKKEIHPSKTTGLTEASSVALGAQQNSP